MAKGRQIYLQAEEINELATLLSFRIENITANIEDTCESLHWAIGRRRQLGPKPKPQDIDPRLPDPVSEYNVLLRSWQTSYDYPIQLLRSIREDQAERAKLRKLEQKLWYYE